jgi:glycosyltransferase involved in cell wall biosynthesis
MGPTLATEIILESSLSETFDLLHLDTSHHDTLATLGAISQRNVFSALKHSAQLVSMIVRKRPEVVYIPISQTTIGYLKDSLFILLCKALGGKVVCHLRGGFFRQWFDSANALVQRYVRMVHSAVDAQIVLGECLRPLFDSLVPEDAIFVVPNGRDFDFAPSTDPAQPNATLRVLYLGNLFETKGVLDVARAVPLVRSAGCQVEFVFAGSCNNPFVQETLETCQREQGDDVVKLPGRVVGQAKLDLLLGADILVFPTYFPFEGHPWVIVEAMAAGLPIVSTDHAAIRESVQEGVNGYLVAKQAPDDIADKVIELCRDKELRHRMGKASRDLYEAKFTEAKMVESMTAALTSVLPPQQT